MLPNCTAIYFVSKNSELLYIGAAERLCFRFAGNHHKRDSFGDTIIAWLETPVNDLIAQELQFIRHFRPPLNQQGTGSIPRVRTSTSTWPKEVTAMLAEIGAKGGKVGGKSKSDAKKSASARNLEAAREKRWPKKTKVSR